MKKLLSSLLVATILCFATPMQALAGNRVLVYLGMNPDSNLQSQNARMQRLQDGIVLRDLLGPLAQTGAWSNLLITPATGLNVTINAAVSNQLGAIYQFAADDVNPLPNCCSSESLPADSTQGVIVAYQPSNVGNPSTGPFNYTNTDPSSSLGPLTAPAGAGNYVNYLIEAQISSTNDTAAGIYPFISNTGIVTYNNVPTQRSDVLVYQISSTSPGSTNTACATAPVPNPDSGWIPVGWVCVEHGQSTITSGEVTMDVATNFTGGTFGKLTFGGMAASDGLIDPSTLTTHYSLTPCNLPDGGGFAFQNQSSGNNGGNILVGDLAGDVSVCGSELYIYNQNSASTPAEITVDTATDQGSATVEHLYPASNNDNVTTSGSCANGTNCALAQDKVICYNAGAATTASFSPSHTWAGEVVINGSEPGSGTGVEVHVLNISGGAISGGSTIGFDYTCF